MATATEFDMFINYCKVKRLDPIKGDAILVVFGRGPKRKAQIITTQSGMRAIADRTGAYHPAKPGDTVWTYTPYEIERQRHLKEAALIFNIKERTARINEIRENMPLDPANPFGLVECRTVIYKNGLPVEGIAKWVAFAPVEPSPHCYHWVDTGETYEDTGKPKKRKEVKPGIDPLDHLVLDTSGQWGDGGEPMLAKCATVNALKAAFPDDFDHGFQTEETMAKAFADERTASELADLGEQQRRMKAINQNPDEYVWEDGYHPVNSFGDVVLRSVRACKFKDEYDALMNKKLNKESFNRFWANRKNDALDIKTEFDRIAKTLQARPKLIIIDHEESSVPTNA